MGWEARLQRGHAAQHENPQTYAGAWRGLSAETLRHYMQAVPQVWLGGRLMDADGWQIVRKHAKPTKAEQRAKRAAFGRAQRVLRRRRGATFEAVDALWTRAEDGAAIRQRFTGGQKPNESVG